MKAFVIGFFMLGFALAVFTYMHNSGLLFAPDTALQGSAPISPTPLPRSTDADGGVKIEYPGVFADTNVANG